MNKNNPDGLQVEPNPLTEGEGRPRDHHDIEDREEKEEVLEVFIEKACRKSRKDAEETKEAGRWKTSTWEFTRLCRTYPKLAGLTANQAYKCIPWDYTDYDGDEILMFVTEWDEVRVPTGKNPLLVALELSKQRPLITDQRFKNYALFVSMCGYLQKQLGDNDIFLPVELLGHLIKVSPRIISNYRKIACKEKILVETQKWTRRLAARYRFNMDSFPELRENH